MVVQATYEKPFSLYVRSLCLLATDWCKYLYQLPRGGLSYNFCCCEKQNWLSSKHRSNVSSQWRSRMGWIYDAIVQSSEFNSDTQLYKLNLHL